MSNWPKGIDPGLVLTCIFVGFLLYWFLPTNHARVLPPRVVTKPHADYDDVDEIDESMTDKPAASPAGDSSRSWVPFAPSQPSVPEVDQPQKISPQQREKRSELAPGQLPRIAVVIDDLGLNERATKAAIALPAAVTLSFLPYGEHATALAGAARAQGHELLLHMPMQPVGHDDPGPGALTVDLKEDEIAARVRKAFEAIPEAIGVNNHMGSRFTANGEKLAPVMREVKARHLFFLDSKTSPHSVAVEAASAAGVPALARDIFLDDTVTEAEVQRELARAEAVAKQHGSAIAIGHPHPSTLKVLTAWLAALQGRGFRLVPLAALLPDGKGAAQ